MTESTHEVALLEARRCESPTGVPLSEALHSASPSWNKSREAGQLVEAAKDVVFGSTAGMVGKVIEYPFDTVKVRLQSSTRYTGPLDCFKQSFRSEGIAGLYRGLTAPMFGAAVETSSLFFSYRLAQEAFQSNLYKGSDAQKQQLPLTVLLLCGAASGAFTSLLLTPIELVKCQLQIPADQINTRATASAERQGFVHRNPLTVIASVYRHGGLAGFWHGQLGTLIRETGGSAAWFGSYEGVSALFRKYANRHLNVLDAYDPALKQEAPSPDLKPHSLPIWQQMVAGACAGVSYNFVFYPADTVKSRMQTEHMGGSTGSIGKPQRTTFWAVAKLLWHEQGLRGLYRGCGITVARAAPSSAFIFTIHETLRQHFA